MNEAGKILLKVDDTVNEVTAYNHNAGFDPMTGEPKMITVVQNGFDPMTGKPLYYSIVSDSFDPMTGRQVYKPQKAISISDSEDITSSAYTPQTKVIAPPNSANSDSIVTDTPSKKTFDINPKILIGVAAGVVALIIAIVILVSSGAFTSPLQKILLASYRTVNDDTFGKTIIDSADILSSGDMNTTVDVTASVGSENYSFNGQFSTNLDKAQVYLEGKVEFDSVNQSVKFYSDDQKIRLAAPDLLDDVYEYNFTKRNTKGYIADFIDLETRGSIDDFNNVLKYSTELIKKSSKYNKVQKSKVLKALNEIQVESIPKDYFEVDGKDRKCTGYEVKITSKAISAIQDAIEEANEEVYGENLEALSESLGNLTGETINLSQYYNSGDISRLSNILEDVHIEVYLYKKMLAAVKIKYENTSILLEFQGGDTRTSNLVATLKSGGSKTKIIKQSSLKGSKEKGSIRADGEEIDYSYDTSSGDLQLEYGNMSLPTITYKVKGDTITISAKYLADSGYLSALKADATISKGAKIGSIKGNIVDLGELSESDIYDIGVDLFSQFGNYFY